MIPWQFTDHYVRLSQAVTTPICTGVPSEIWYTENTTVVCQSNDSQKTGNCSSHQALGTNTKSFTSQGRASQGGKESGEKDKKTGGYSTGVVTL
jgi:hypothetical protein